MDMNSLNTSLPKPTSRRHMQPPPDPIVQAFKKAALEVTNLYRLAGANVEESYLRGYDQALTDLVTKLDNCEFIRKVREDPLVMKTWILERRAKGPNSKTTCSQSEDEKDEDRNSHTKTSPISSGPPLTQNRSRSSSTNGSDRESKLDSRHDESSFTSDYNAPGGIFTYISPIPYPYPAEGEVNVGSGPTQTVHRDIYAPRMCRTGQKHPTSRSYSKTASINLPSPLSGSTITGAVPGSKRKTMSIDFSDFGAGIFGRDGGTNGKKARNS